LKRPFFSRYAITAAASFRRSRRTLSSSTEFAVFTLSGLEASPRKFVDR
jgi:hypothetical protein